MNAQELIDEARRFNDLDWLVTEARRRGLGVGPIGDDEICRAAVLLAGAGITWHDICARRS